MLNIKYNLKPNSERRTEQFVPDKPIGFGKLRTDHMFLMDYKDEGWNNPRIEPYGPLQLMPGASVLHYSQTIFEGAKAFQHKNNEIYMFRINQNVERFNKSAELLCMPKIKEEKQIQAIESLINVDRLFYPQQDNSSLYIRPFMFSTEDALGVKPSESYTYCVMLSPSGPYYGDNVEAIKLLITKDFHRVAPGGIGQAKSGGNYAASLRAAKKAKKFGCKQVLYTDVTGEYIEEAGSMNHYHVTSGGEIIIPKFTDTILESITSKSVIELSDKLGHKVSQEKISLESFIDGIVNGEISEAGGLGTAAVVSPVNGYVFDDGKEIVVSDGKIGDVSKNIYEIITGIQTGKLEAPKGWLRKVEKKL